MSTIIYTDGACRGNPGPGGWAWIAAHPLEAKASGHDPDTTNNRMEMTAALEAIRAYQREAYPGRLLIVSDSAYVVNCFSAHWYKGWLKRGWKKSDGKPVLNRDLWEPLVGLSLELDVTYQWVKGHSGDSMNDLVDEMAVKASHGIVVP